MLVQADAENYILIKCTAEYQVTPFHKTHLLNKRCDYMLYHFLKYNLNKTGSLKLFKMLHFVHSMY